MKAPLSLVLVCIVGSLYAQPTVKAVEDPNLGLEARYSEMKTGSQTFKDYKVIKEVVLDKVWKITFDSITKKDRQLAEVKKEVTSLQGELTNTRNSMQTQQDSMKEVVYDSTHISLLGIPFAKNIFILLTAAVVGGLVFLLSITLARVKIANNLVKEKALIADSVAHEFEDFKKKSMEKQTKLSRELQNERNKWQEHRKL